MRLTFTGDILPANRECTMGFGIADSFSANGVRNVWTQSLREIFSTADICFANLEATLTDVGSQSASEPFAGNAAFASFLKDAGVDIVSVANNHILEHGKNIFYQTCDILEKAGVRRTGIFQNGRSNIEISRCNGVSIGFASFNGIHDIPNNNIYANLDHDTVVNTIDAMKKLGTDYTVLSFHWGNEYVNIPSYDQIEFARFAIDRGADIIAGHHPHVIQPVEQYKHGLIMYSLGNFMFDMLWSKQVRTGMVVNVDIERDKKLTWSVIPLTIKKDYTPVIMKDSRRFEKKLAGYTSYMKDLYERGREAYTAWYRKLVKRNRAIARLLMKKQLLLDWHKLSPESRRKVLHNIRTKVLPVKS